VPTLNPVEAEIGWSLIVIGYGVWKERHYVGIDSALVNLAGFLMVNVSVGLPSNLGFLLGIYMILGWWAIESHDYAYMELLGSKPYGSLLLAIGLAQLGYIGNDFNSILGYWVLIAVVSHFVMVYLAPEQTSIHI
jgi:hypothetical protein